MSATGWLDDAEKRARRQVDPTTYAEIVGPLIETVRDLLRETVGGRPFGIYDELTAPPLTDIIERRLR